MMNFYELPLLLSHGLTSTADLLLIPCLLDIFVFLAVLSSFSSIFGNFF